MWVWGYFSFPYQVRDRLFGFSGLVYVIAKPNVQKCAVGFYITALNLTQKICTQCLALMGLIENGVKQY